MELKNNFETAPWRDKKNWGDGPWHNEPDFKQFTYKDYICVAKRNFLMGNWLGYVLVPKGGKYDIDYDELNLNVHGGLTYAGEVYFADMMSPNPNINDWVCIGFDCAHAEDLMPAYEAMNKYIKDHSENNETLKKLYDLNCNTEHLWKRERAYRDLEFVENELRYLVDQMIEQEKNGLL